METKTNKKRVTITAEDNIGRKESITLLLEEATAKRLEKAANNTTPEGTHESELQEELNLMLMVRMNYNAYFTESQYNRINKFMDLIYHKFYKYTLNIEIFK